MRLIRKETRKNFYGRTLVGYDTIYIVDQLPKEEDYIEIGNKKGYVVSIQYDEKCDYHVIYLEKNLGDWYNQVCDICDVVIVNLERK